MKCNPGPGSPRRPVARGLVLLICVIVATLWQLARLSNGYQTFAADPSLGVNLSEATSDQTEFFEKRVRPVLAENCFACHAEKVQMAGLRLDSLDGMLKGTDTGHVVLVPEHPEKSALIRAITYDGEIKMPPPGKLSAKDIEALTEWVKMGAPWAEATSDKTKASLKAEAWKNHWAFQRLRSVPFPKVKNQTWVRSPVDAFILAKLEENGMLPAKPADRRTLIRRATFDLIGLPPTPDEVSAFEKDTSSDPFARVIDRLLGSAHYGERWGRHWLDVARYGDSRGFSLVGLPEELRYPFSYTYRDWVIRAFNEDMPYDQFLLYQIAADRLSMGENKRSLAALGFLTLGRRFQNNTHEIIDDRIDVVFRGTQATTVSCARCHDHKYDPIPTKDYYSLYGVFAGSEEKTVPLMSRQDEAQEYLDYERELKKLEQKVKDFLEAERDKLLLRFRSQVDDYLLAAHAAQMLKPPTGEMPLNLVLVERWRSHLEKTRQGVDPVFTPWHAFASLPEKEFASKAPVVARELLNGETRVNPLLTQVLVQNPPTSLREVAQRYGQLLRSVDERWQEALKPAAKGNSEPPKELQNPAQEQLRLVLYGEDSPTNIPAEGKQGIHIFLEEDSKDQLVTLKRSMLRWSLSPAAPPHALIVEDSSNQKNPRVFLRGNPEMPGEEIPRQFLLMLAGEKRQPFQNGSGRLELAQAIASRDNPLTARVMVNRIWLHLFGSGLVPTPSDFGLRSEPPAHPELLDHLALRFMEDGWSVKKLIRLLVLSSVYRQSDEGNPEYRLVDPENRLLSAMNRRRLDFEAMRDSILVASGQLDPNMGGPPVDLMAQEFSRRRTIYGFVDRENLPGFFRIFDFASPDAHSPQRYTTTVPQQALFMMNSPFVIEQARLLAHLRGVNGNRDSESRIRALYRQIYQRDPTAKEVTVGLKFIHSASGRSREASSPKPGVWQYGYGKYDEADNRVTHFTLLGRWTFAVQDQIEKWRLGPEMPDPRHGRLVMTAEGGHPGPDLEHAVIRRWVAPRTGEVAVEGLLTAPPLFSDNSVAGDGVRGTIVSSRLGELGSWTVHNGFTETKVERVNVERGDTIDFVVDCRNDPNYDSFEWIPTIRMLEISSEQNENEQSEWNAASEFSGPEEKAPDPLTPWAKYAQVLLIGNEFLFVQ